jgi:hypothetical protein
LVNKCLPRWQSAEKIESVAFADATAGAFQRGAPDLIGQRFMVDKMISLQALSAPVCWCRIAPAGKQSSDAVSVARGI